MEALFDEIEMPLVFALFDMEQAGVKVEAGSPQRIRTEIWASRSNDWRRRFLSWQGRPLISIRRSSWESCSSSTCSFPHGKKTKTGYSTAADILEKLAPDYPVVSKILEYRQLAKLKSTYADGLVNFISEDHRIHGTFNQTVTATGRISSTEPNLQNIPIRMELGRQIRKVFVPEEGFVFVDADYSQIELRILAHCSDDDALIQAYRGSQGHPPDRRHPRCSIHRLTR